MKRLAILGATGSIGTSALDIIQHFPEKFSVFALAAGRNIEKLAAQIHQCKPALVSVETAALRDELAKMLPGSSCELLWGEEGLHAVAASAESDFVLSAITGAAGLLPTKFAVEAGKTIGLANKESLVMGGELLTELARQKNARLVPVDSEHSAIFQCLQGNRHSDVSSLILTASGGPFRDYTREQLHNVTAEQALSHPTWEMGPKVTIDSATLMNKGLEVIEARWLFDFSADQIEVIIHPQSIIHSMVRYCDGNVIAQLSRPDMKLPILYSMTYPERFQPDLPPLDLLETGSLSFVRPDMDRFPCLSLAFQALKQGDGATIVLNRADELAVQAFLSGKITFMDVPRILHYCLDRFSGRKIRNFDDISEIDAWTIRVASSYINTLKK